MQKVLLLLSLAILTLSSRWQQTDIKKYWLLTKIEKNGEFALYKSDCVPFIDPKGSVGCYNHGENEIYVDGVWKKQSETKMTITQAEATRKYIIYSWSEKEIVIGLENKPTEREYYMRQ
jgi:hypothetical protein